MAELIKNPLTAVAFITAADILGIIGIVIYTLRKYGKGKRLKKLIITVVCLAAADAVISFLILSSATLYDRNGTSYFEAESVRYYDENQNVYHLITDENLKEYLISENGTSMFLAERVYIDKDGYIVYDRFDEFKQEKEFIFTNGDGNEYYPIKAVKWYKNGQIAININ